MVISNKTTDELAFFPQSMRSLGILQRVSEIELPAGQWWALRGDHRGGRIICQHGRLWITQESDANDHFLKGGEEFLVTHFGLVIIEALSRTTLRILPPA